MAALTSTRPTASQPPDGDFVCFSLPAVPCRGQGRVTPSGTPSSTSHWALLTVTIGALAPSKEDAVAAGFGDERTRYFKWRRVQLEKRALHVSGRHRLCQTDTVCLSVKSCSVSHSGCVSFSHRLCVSPTHTHSASLAHSPHSVAHSLTSLAHSLTRCLTHSLPHASLTRCLTHSLPHSLTVSLAASLPASRLPHCLTPHSRAPSFPTSFLWQAAADRGQSGSRCGQGEVGDECPLSPGRTPGLGLPFGGGHRRRRRDPQVGGGAKVEGDRFEGFRRTQG